MATVFTQIRTGEISGHILEDTGEFFSILDITPRQKGHTLVIPYQETDDIFDLSTEQYQDLWTYVASVAARLRQIVPCQKVAIMVEGLEVAHTHVHLIPISQPGDLSRTYSYNHGEQDQLVETFQALS